MKAFRLSGCQVSTIRRVRWVVQDFDRSRTFKDMADDMHEEESRRRERNFPNSIQLLPCNIRTYSLLELSPLALKESLAPDQLV